MKTLNNQEVTDVVNGCSEHFAGHAPHIQGAALAVLLAKWLAGHFGVDRELLLQSHLTGVREMIPIVLEMHGMKEPYDA